MPTTAEYKSIIQKMKRPRLLDFWKLIIERNTSGWEKGKAFEFLVLRAFELEGAVVRWPYSVNLFGEDVEQIDGVIHLGKHVLSVLVECKDQVAKVNGEPIAKIRNQLLRRPSSTIGAIFTTTGFTEPALMLAKFLNPQTVLLWEKSNIEFCLQSGGFVEGMIMKYQRAVEEGLPDFDVRNANKI